MNMLFLVKMIDRNNMKKFNYSLQVEPIEMPPDPMMMEQAFQMGMPPPPPIRLPSIEPDFDVDNHVLEADIVDDGL